MKFSLGVLSNPIGYLSKILYINESFLDINKVREIKGVKKKNLDFLINSALKRQKDKDFQEVYKINREYLSRVYENLEILNGREIVFLDFQNLGKHQKEINFKKTCIDDFSPYSKVSEFFMQLDVYFKKFHKEKSKEKLENIVFYRLSPFDFPFEVKNEEFPKIVNPFFSCCNDLFLQGTAGEKIHLRGLKRHTRNLSDTCNKDNLKENYHFSKFVFSIEYFREHLKEEKTLNYLLTLYNAHHPVLEQKINSKKYFSELIEDSIKINREFMKIKYQCIVDRLKLKKINAYMLQGDIGVEILNKVGDVKIIGEKLLANTKNVPSKGVLEYQAMNRFSGWITAKSQEDEMIIEDYFKDLRASKEKCERKINKQNRDNQKKNYTLTF